MDLAVYGVLCGRREEREAAYRLLAYGLEREAGAVPRLERAPGGKPFFPERPDLQFNLSHSRGAAVCALHSQSVGVDVERLRPAPRRLARGMEDEAFFRLWTAKEATIKRQGRGVEALLGPLEPDPRCRLLDGFLPGWVVTVCPGQDIPVRTVRVAWDKLLDERFAIYL